MLSWERVADEIPTMKHFRQNITLSSFAVNKDYTRDRLISWPRAQNEFGPNPINPLLPIPDASFSIQTDDDSILALHFDVQDMFHHLLLTPRLVKLFPLKAFRLKNLPRKLQLSLSRLYNQSLQPEGLLRLFHATIPMGWTWAVTIANGVAHGLLDCANTIFMPSSYAQSFRRLGSHFHYLEKGDAVTDAYIDDALGICVGRFPHDVTLLYQHIAEVFESHGLSLHPCKSLPRDKIQMNCVLFIGWTWHLTHLMRPGM